MAEETRGRRVHERWGALAPVVGKLLVAPAEASSRPLRASAALVGASSSGGRPSPLASSTIERWSAPGARRSVSIRRTTAPPTTAPTPASVTVERRPCRAGSSSRVRVHRGLEPASWISRTPRSRWPKVIQGCSRLPSYSDGAPASCAPTGSASAGACRSAARRKPSGPRPGSLRAKSEATRPSTSMACGIRTAITGRRRC